MGFNKNKYQGKRLAVPDGRGEQSHAAAMEIERTEGDGVEPTPEIRHRAEAPAPEVTKPAETKTVDISPAETTEKKTADKDEEKPEVTVY